MRGRPRWRSGARVRSTALSVVAAFAAVALAACTAGSPVIPSSSAPPTASGAATAVAAPTSAATDAVLPEARPRLSAQENLPSFDAVNARVIAANPQAGGRDFIDALVSAGFEKADMQVTPDKTSIGLAVGSVQFSVRFNGECLIGQYGSDGVGYHSELTPLLSTGDCLIGETRPIDW